ncbi:MAG: hypothetical protein IJ506_03190 [Clostridia bacterium]|nr:hypothetical protein [Clostridia bacterium]
MAKKKKKKEKIVYYDDNSTISDMSGVSRSRGNSAPKSTKQDQSLKQVQGTSKWRTFWSAFKMMLLPTVFALAVIGVLYLLLMLATGNLF